ncbi:MAG TPA: Nramp family divalent metal transporter, partial [Xanthobacteraceae bacterium]|nr:Nramp family divalent metal transporter [Xanthobacteraceae bacterium]
MTSPAIAESIAESIARPASLTARTVATAHQALAGRRIGPRTALAFAGPAVIASIAYMDPGNFATNIQAGARYGYSLLWVALLANLIAMLFQALSAKLGIATGRNLAELCRAHFPTPVVWAMWVISEIAAIATDLAEFLGAALGFYLLFHFNMMMSALLTGVFVFLILATEIYGFRRLEHV